MISKSSKVLVLLVFFALSSSSSSSWWWSWMKVTVVGITATTTMSGGIIGVTSFQPNPIFAGKKPLLLPSSSSALSLDVVGYVISIFSRGQEEKQQQQNNNKSSDLNPPSAAAITTTLEPWMRISQIMEAMTDMESAQKASRLASVLLQDLKSNTIVEGLSPNGKIKVYFDGQQKPLKVVIEKEVGGGADDDTLDLATSITLAMQDAHHKSIEKMDEKIKNLYADLGFLPPPSG